MLFFAQCSAIDLLSILRETVLTTDFILPLLNELDIASISSSFLSDQLKTGLTADLEFLSDSLDEAVAALAPAIKNAVAEAGNQLIDHITGISPTLRAEVSLAPVLDDLEDTMRQAFLDAVPTQWDELPQAQQDQLLDDFVTQVRNLIPTSFTIDETMIGSDLPDQIGDGLDKAETTLSKLRDDIAEDLAGIEDGLEEPRTYIGWFLGGYLGLIGLLAVLILAIVGLHRKVKESTRQLGTTALICGIVGVIAIFAGDSFFTGLSNVLDIPQALADIPGILITDILAPFRTISYGLVGGGVVLIAVSLIYPRLRARDVANGAPSASDPESST